MKRPEAYRDREQTYLKHFFLERYLERVAYNIGWGNPEFVYIDGFSGPWRSEDEAFEDTSFMIAIRQLRKVRDSLAKHDRARKIRCVFVESNPNAFAELQQAIESIADISIKAIHGEFENVIPEIVGEVGPSFTLTFIDPTGWTGFALDTIAPLLQGRGEVLVNFMFDYVNRFQVDDRVATANSFNKLFGGAGWEEPERKGEESMLEFYGQRLKEKCGFTYATHTRILKPLSDRTYFYLVYATRHPKGLVEFRGVEKQFLREQERVRASAKQTERIKKSHQGELFRDADAEHDALRSEVDLKCLRAEGILKSLLDKKGPRRFMDVLPPMLEVPMVDRSAAADIMLALRQSGWLAIDGMKPRQRVPNEGCVLRKLP